MMKKIIFLTVSFCLNSIIAFSQQNIDNLSWYKVAAGMPQEWYGTDRAIQIADKVVEYQTEIGGWPKNIGFHKEVDKEEMVRIKATGIGATFDNEATIMEMRFLAKVYSFKNDEKYKESFLKAFDYIMKAQYANGGWPQFYPVRKGKSVAYSGCITFNDGAYVNVMNILKDIYEDSSSFASLRLDDNIKNLAKKSFDKGIDCILKTQIMVNGVPTVWCAQHDEKTLAPAKARAYELPSFSGDESAEIVLLLMNIKNPSAEIVASVKGAVKWFEEHKIPDVKFERYRDEKGERNARIVPAKGENIWARFYDLDTSKPYFCDRDGIKKSSIDEIGKERRGGYSWYVNRPERVLKAYQKWIKKN